MSLDLTMNAAMDIPVSGGSIVHWKFVLISIAYCSCSIFIWEILLSFGENDGNRQPKETLLRPEVNEWRINVPHLQGDDHDHHDVQSEGAGGRREQSGIGYDHNKGGEYEAEMAEGEIGTVSNLPIPNRLHVSDEGLRKRHPGASGRQEQSGIGAEDESNLPIPNRLHVSDEGLRKRLLGAGGGREQSVIRAEGLRKRLPEAGGGHEHSGIGAERETETVSNEDVFNQPVWNRFWNRWLQSLQYLINEANRVHELDKRILQFLVDEANRSPVSDEDKRTLKFLIEAKRPILNQTMQGLIDAKMLFLIEAKRLPIQIREAKRLLISNRRLHVPDETTLESLTNEASEEKGGKVAYVVREETNEASGEEGGNVAYVVCEGRVRIRHHDET